MKNKTLIFFIDALRPDYITKKNTPNLYNFKNENNYANLISLLGYSSGIHPTIWTGKYQEEHEKFLVYSFDPKNSPFKWMKILKFIPSKIRRYVIGSLKAPYYLLPINKKYFPKFYKKKILPLPASIDPNVAGYFKIESYEYKISFFNLLKKNNISYSSQPDYYNENYGQGVGLENWKLTDKDLDFYFSYDLDALGHYPGPNSNLLLNKINEIDKIIGKIISNAKKKYDKLNIFIFSDHGMEKIVGTIDIKKILDKSDLKLVKDYIVFYDSTMVRFWYKNDVVKNKIVKLLSNTNHLTYLDDKLKEKYHINFKDKKWGQLFFLADNGYRIFPDYFAPVKFNTKGMHGYFPEKENAKGIFMTNVFKLNKKDINIIDLYATLLKSQNILNELEKDSKSKPLY